MQTKHFVGILCPEAYKMHSEIIGTCIDIITSKGFIANVYSTYGPNTHYYIYDELTDLKYNKLTIDDFKQDHNQLKWIISITPDRQVDLLSNIDKTKIINIVHSQDRHERYMKNLICLTPLFAKLNPHIKCSTICQTYKLRNNLLQNAPLQNDITHKIICVAIGHLKDYKKLISLANCKRVILHVIDRKMSVQYNKILCKYNIKTHKGIPTEDMVKLIQSCHFIVPAIDTKGVHWKNPQKVRLCSSIPFALTFEKPMIVQSAISRQYALNGCSLIFKSLITEVHSDINSLTTTKYERLVENIKKKKDYFIECNKKNTASFFK